MPKSSIWGPLGPPKIAQAVTKAFKKASSPLNFWGSWEVVAKRRSRLPKRSPPHTKMFKHVTWLHVDFSKFRMFFCHNFWWPDQPVSQRLTWYTHRFRQCHNKRKLVFLHCRQSHNLTKLINGVGGMRRSLWIILYMFTFLVSAANNKPKIIILVLLHWF